MADDKSQNKFADKYGFCWFWHEKNDPLAYFFSYNSSQKKSLMPINSYMLEWVTNFSLVFWHIGFQGSQFFWMGFFLVNIYEYTSTDMYLHNVEICNYILLMDLAFDIFFYLLIFGWNLEVFSWMLCTIDFC